MRASRSPAVPVAAGVFARMPRLDRVIIVEKRLFDGHWVQLWAACVGVRWDLVVDLRGSALSLVLRARRRAIMRGGRRAGPRLGHLAGALGLAEAVLPVAWTSAEDRARAAVLLPDGGPIVGLGPTANWAGKVWPAERFVALFAALAAEMPGARVAVFGGPGAQEAAMAAPVLAGLPGAIDLVGRLSLPEAASCLARCALFVGNDSGLMHLAASAGAPTLGLFGPTPASEYGPAGPLGAAVLAEGPAGASAMAALSVEAALEAARGLLARAAARPALVKVAHIMAGAAQGGAELFYERLVPALAGSGDMVLPVIRRDAGRAGRLVAAGASPVQLGFGGRLDVLTRPRLRRVLRGFGPRVAVAWMGRAARHTPAGPIGCWWGGWGVITTSASSAIATIWWATRRGWSTGSEGRVFRPIGCICWSISSMMRWGRRRLCCRCRRGRAWCWRWGGCIGPKASMC